MNTEQHKITHVSDYTKDWSSDKWGDFTTYYCKVDGVEGVVEINKKSGADGPAAGDTLEGTFTETDYTDKQGNLHYKFKAVRSFGGSRPAYQPKDEAAIKAMWAIGQAVVLHNHMQTGTNTEFDYIENTAKDLFAMVDMVKAGKAPEGNAREWDKLGKKKDEVIDPDTVLADGDMPEDFLKFGE